jgi:C-terminal processing protease CtpA/Prc
MPVAGRPAPAPPGTPVTGSANQSGAPAARGRWGIGTRADACEPTAPVIVRVGEGMPAERAGLRAGDRVVAIDGAACAGQDDMVARLATAGTQVTLDLDRKGRIEQVTMRSELAAVGSETR